MLDYSNEFLNYVGIRLKNSSDSEINSLKISQESTHAIFSNDLGLPLSKKHSDCYTYLVNYSDVIAQKEKEKEKKLKAAEFKPSVSSPTPAPAEASPPEIPVSANPELAPSSSEANLPASASASVLSPSASANNLPEKIPTDPQSLAVSGSSASLPPSLPPSVSSFIPSSTGSVREAKIQEFMRRTGQTRDNCVFFLDASGDNLEQAIEEMERCFT